DLMRELTFDVDPELYPSILGNGDTEVCFYLALTYGLAKNPVEGMTRMVDRVERARAEHKITDSFRPTMCASDGTRLIVLRWVSPDVEDISAPTLYHAAGPTMLQTVDGYTDTLLKDEQLEVSAPLQLQWSKHVWHEVPAGSIGIFRQGQSPEYTPVEANIA